MMLGWHRKIVTKRWMDAMTGRGIFRKYWVPPSPPPTPPPPPPTHIPQHQTKPEGKDEESRKLKKLEFWPKKPGDCFFGQWWAPSCCSFCRSSPWLL